MKNLILILAMLISSIKTYSQITIVDSISHKPLPFSEIHWNNEGGLYSSKNGSFLLKNVPTSSSYIEVSFLGYIPKKISTENIEKGDSIFLNPKPVELNTVIISGRKKKIKHLKSNRKSLGWPLSASSEFITIIKPNTKLKNTLISKIEIPLEKPSIILKKKNAPNGGKLVSQFKNSIKNHKYFIRINIYSIKNNKPLHILYRSNPIGTNPLKSNVVSISLNKESILFLEEGLGIGIETIGFDSVTKDSLYTITPRISLTNKKSEYYEAQSLLKFHFPTSSYRDLPTFMLNNKKNYFYLKLDLWIKK